MKNRMTKRLLIVLIGSLLLTMAACGSDKTPEATSAAQQTTVAAEPAPTEAVEKMTETETDEDDSAGESVDMDISTDDKSVECRQIIRQTFCRSTRQLCRKCRQYGQGLHDHSPFQR
jgi:hypothetical protein